MRAGRGEIKSASTHLSCSSQQVCWSRMTAQNNLAATLLFINSLEEARTTRKLKEKDGGRANGCLARLVGNKRLQQRVCPGLKLGRWHKNRGLDENCGRANGIKGITNSPEFKQVPTPQCHSGTKHCQQSNQLSPEIVQCHACAFRNNVPSTQLCTPKKWSSRKVKGGEILCAQKRNNISSLY